MSTNSIHFGKFLVTKQVFYKSKHSYALVNLKPLVPGHVLVVPTRTECISLADLTPEENIDYFTTLQLVHQFIKNEFKADSMNIAIQDGPEAGQTVPHLHTHVIPRYKLNNIGDRIYKELDEWTFDDRVCDWQERRKKYQELGGRVARKQLSIPDAQRTPRSAEDMIHEAQTLSTNFQLFLKQNSHLLYNSQ